MFGLPVDADNKQYIRDLFQPDKCCIDTRFVIRDGKKHPFAVICPGGAYAKVCSYIEGVPFAKKLNEEGISAFIVYYRIKKHAKYPAPQRDLANAVRHIFRNSDRYCLDTDHYSVWGSSAGGHLAASFGTENMGYVKYSLPKPEAMILVYPVISMRKEYTHPETHDNLLGADASPAGELFASVEAHVTDAYPPTYVWAGDADETVQPENTRMMAKALETAGVCHAWDIFPGVGHGVGPGTGTSAEGWIDKAVQFWRSCGEW